jgi:hypothetical protein
MPKRGLNIAACEIARYLYNAQSYYAKKNRVLFVLDFINY